MLKSAVKQNYRLLQKLFKTEGSFDNWTTLRWQKCHQSQNNQGCSGAGTRGNGVPTLFS